MATRGTYTAEGILLYNHWDNYPSGAAHHFLNVIKKYKNLSLFSIIRGMKAIEKGGSIFDGRAEYHYKIFSDKIECYKVHSDKDEIFLISSGTIENWINTNITENLEPTDKPENFTVIKVNEGFYSTQKKLYKNAIIIFDQAEKSTQANHIGNGASQFESAFKMFKMSNLNYDDFKNLYIKKYVPLFTERYQHANNTIFLNYCTN